MAIDELQKLTAAYKAVFDENDKIKTCEQDARKHLISLMKKYTSKNIGDIEKGIVNTGVLQEAYFHIIAT